MSDPYHEANIEEIRALLREMKARVQAGEQLAMGGRIRESEEPDIESEVWDD